MVNLGSIQNYIDEILRHILITVSKWFYTCLEGRGEGGGGGGGTADGDNTADVRNLITWSIVYDPRVVLDSLCSRGRLHRTVNKYVCICTPARSMCRYSTGN